jgi:hypothetical protein
MRAVSALVTQSAALPLLSSHTGDAFEVMQTRVMMLVTPIERAHQASTSRRSPDPGVIEA